MESNELPFDQILEICRRQGATNVKIFGSRARGDARPDSDLDLLVEVAKGTSLFDLIRMQIDLEKLLGIRVDIVTEASVRAELREQVLKEARVIAA